MCYNVLNVLNLIKIFNIYERMNSYDIKKTNKDGTIHLNIN